MNRPRLHSPVREKREGARAQRQRRTARNPRRRHPLAQQGCVCQPIVTARIDSVVVQSGEPAQRPSKESEGRYAMAFTDDSVSTAAQRALVHDGNPLLTVVLTSVNLVLARLSG